jgi:hypothetical protein
LGSSKPGVLSSLEEQARSVGVGVRWDQYVLKEYAVGLKTTTSGTGGTGRFADSTGTLRLDSILSAATGVSSGTLSGAIDR